MAASMSMAVCTPSGPRIRCWSEQHYCIGPYSLGAAACRAFTQQWMGLWTMADPQLRRYGPSRPVAAAIGSPIVAIFETHDDLILLNAIALFHSDPRNATRDFRPNLNFVMRYHVAGRHQRHVHTERFEWQSNPDSSVCQPVVVRQQRERYGAHKQRIHGAKPA